MPAPREFGPELTNDFLASLVRPIDKQAAIDEGRAYSEAASRGQSGQALAGSLIASAREGAAERKSRAVSDFNYNLANLTREERLRNQGQEWHLKDQEYQAAEAQKAREFQERMTLLGFEHQQQLADQQAEGQMIGSLASAGGMVAGSILGGPVGGYIGAQFGSMMAPKPLPRPSMLPAGNASY